jgi:hypothetical protein
MVKKMEPGMANDWSLEIGKWRDFTCIFASFWMGYDFYLCPFWLGFDFYSHLFRLLAHFLLHFG